MRILGIHLCVFLHISSKKQSMLNNICVLFEITLWFRAKVMKEKGREWFLKMTLEKMAVDGIGTNKMDVLMCLWTLHYWIKEGTLWRDRSGVTNSVVRIKKLFSVGGVRLFLNRALEEDDQQPVLSLLPSKWSWTILTVVLSWQVVHQVGLPCLIQPYNGHHHQKLRSLLKNLQCFRIYW